ncbi:MAG: RHS repeat protein, partial [Bacteroidales bacterium]|nr:RHS repeat protein [Bacteroidales bacterium]
MIQYIIHNIRTKASFILFLLTAIPCLAYHEVGISLQGKGILTMPSSSETHYESPATAQVVISWTSTPINSTTLRNTLTSALGSYLTGISVSSVSNNKTTVYLQITIGNQESLSLSFTNCSYGAVFYLYFDRPEDSLTLSSNWIRTRSFGGTGTTDYIHDIVYYDGLGLPEQNVSAAASTSGKSIITPVYRDSLFRTDTRLYLPYATSNGSGKKVTSPTAASKYQPLYGADDALFPFGENNYDGYASARPTGETFPGKVFRDQNKHTNITYGSNSSSSQYVFRMSLSTDGKSLNLGNPYDSNTLHLETVTTADGKRKDTYKDKRGKVLLERSWTGSSTYADTYYVYDVNDRLAWIVSPEGSALLSSSSPTYSESAFASKWATVYRYDGRNRVKASRHPGSGWEYMVYDKGGRMVLQQDSTLRVNNRWIYHIYDNAGREINRTLVSSTLSRDSIQSLYDASSFDNTYPTLGGSTDWRVPISTGYFSFVQELETVRYGCDHYRTSTTGTATAKFAIPSGLGFSSITGVVANADRDTTTRGMKIYEKEAILGTSASTVTGGRTYVERAFYYDKKGQLIQTVERNALGGISRTSIKYDYQGRPTAVDERHKTSASDTSNDIKVTEYTYDIRGRILSESVTLNGGTAATVSYTYDEIGRLIGRTFGNGVSEQMTYTTQSWLQSLMAVDTQSATIFALGYDYWNATSATPLYDGNIAELHWTNVGGTQKTYAFSYDRMGRLSGAIQPGSQALSENGISYDRNGNITALTRKNASGGTQSALTYSYNGNLLTSVTNSGTTYSYTHDGNGRLKSDSRQNIAATYNVLNLPDKITLANNASQERGAFLYLADGTKVGAFAKVGTAYYGYLSLGSIVYNKSVSVDLESTDFAAGRILASTSGTGSDVWYYTRDHLGSTRLITGANGTVLERSDYYPYGLRMEGGTQATGNRWHFAGKEEQNQIPSLAWLDFGARM